MWLQGINSTPQTSNNDHYLFSCFQYLFFLTTNLLIDNHTRRDGSESEQYTDKGCCCTQ